jgi:hypothetical protein
MGFVRYTAMAILDITNGGDSQIVAERDFKVVSFLNLDAPYLKEPTTESNEVTLQTYCFRKPKGKIKAEVQVNELGILPGETVRVQINFENTLKKRRFAKKNQKKCVLLSLCQQLDFRSQDTANPHKFAQKSVTIAVHSQVRGNLLLMVLHFRVHANQRQVEGLKRGLWILMCLNICLQHPSNQKTADWLRVAISFDWIWSISMFLSQS